MKISIVGAGHVGSTFAYALLLRGLAQEVLLVDKDVKRATGEALDLAHALPFGRPARVAAGAPADVAGSAITVITAGANQHPGETRLDLLERNADIVRSVAAEAAARNPSGLIVVATNPVDILTRIAFEASGLPAGRVIGSGTILDTARLRHLVGQHFGIDPRSVHTYVIGEHGDSSVVAWSSATIGGVGLEVLAEARGIPFDAEVRARMAHETRNAAYAIVEGKGSTYYAIASALVRLVEAILRDERAVLTVSVPAPSDGPTGQGGPVWLGLPAVVGGAGIVHPLPMILDDEEQQALRRSADILRQAYDRLGWVPNG